MVFKKTLLILISAAVLTALPLSCTGTSSGITRKTEAPDPNKPVWVDNYPVDSEYYIGIGSSNTGNKSEDLEAAKARAITSLAAAISVRITSSQEFVVREDTKGEAYQSAEIFINQTVNRNFREIDVFDSYFSEQSGYWFYYRISRARWAEIERQEKAEIVRQVSDIVSPGLASETAGNAELLSALGRGWNIVTESPYEGSILATINGESGLLIDILENNIERVLNRISINVSPLTYATEPGKYENITIEAIDRSNRPAGQYKIEFTEKGTGTQVSEITTDSNGRYSGRIRFTSIPVGRNTVTAGIALKNYGIESRELRKKIVVPQKDIIVQMDRIAVALNLSVRGDAKIESLPESVKTLFSRDEFALRITSGAGSERFTINFTMFFTNFPENTHGLFITNAKAAISLVQDGSSLYSYETKEYKEVGLSWAQAQERGTIKLFRDINDDAVFINEMHKAIYSVAASD